jgi:hypothetical protein
MATSKRSQSSFERVAIAFAALAIVAMGATACAPDDPVEDAGTWAPVPSDCENYESWTSFDLGGDDAGAGGADACAHLLDVPRTAYINKTPPHGSTEFPVGTMIIKEIKTTPDPSTWQVFAMAKRGGGFDPGSGCVGWEWYGLDAPDGGGGCHFQWSGTQPTANEAYASCGPCASCHSSAQSNDCVIAPELSLSQW